MIAIVIGTLIINTCLFGAILFLIDKKVSDAEKEIPYEVQKEINNLKYNKKEDDRRFELFIQKNDSIYKEQAKLREEIKNCRNELRTKDILIKILTLRLDNDDEENILLDIEEKLSPLKNKE